MYCIVSDTTSAVSIARGGVRAWKVYQSRDVNAVRQTPMCVNHACGRLRAGSGSMNGEGSGCIIQRTKIDVSEERRG